MNCGICKGEAVLVDSLGREMGPPYFYCRTCKLEQKEWLARTPTEPVEKEPDSPSFWSFSGNYANLTPTALKSLAKATMVVDCISCGAQAGQECDPQCSFLNFLKDNHDD